MTLDVSISPELSKLAPELTLGVLRSQVTVSAECPELWEIADGVVDYLRLATTSEPAEIAEIRALRDAYKAAGKSPGRYRGSQEALLRRVLSGKGLYRVNSVVDANNVVSLQTLQSIGTYDLARLQGRVTMRVGAPGETYDAIGKGEINLEGLPLLADEAGPFGSPTSDSTRSMVRPETRDVMMVVMAFSGTGVERALRLATSLLRDHCFADEAHMEAAVVRGVEPVVPFEA